MQQGMILGDYEIAEMIGRGGMGMVWRARQLSLDRLVALKTLPAELGASSEYVERFLREARAAARLNHPNLVSVMDAGLCDNIYFMVMELVEGQSLGQRLRSQGGVDEATALRWMKQAAEALAFAHAQGIVHRDVKPENMLLTRDGVVKVGDLGLAKVQSSADDMSLTSTGATMGTPYYISPEQIRGVKDIDGRADIYSLGMTLYHLLSGRPPYAGNTGAEIMAQHLTEPLPPLQPAQGVVSQGTLDLIAMMTAKDRGERVQEMSAVSEAIGELIEGRGLPKGLRGTRSRAGMSGAGSKRRAGVALAVAGVVLIALVTGAIMKLRGDRERAVAEEKIRAAELVRAVAEAKQRAMAEADERRKAEEKLAAEKEEHRKNTEKLAKEAEERRLAAEKLARENEEKRKSDEKLARENEERRRASEKPAPAVVTQEPSKPGGGTDGVDFDGLHRAMKDPSTKNESNLALAAAKLMTAMNPGMEIVSVDEATGDVKVRDKNTGQTVTLNKASFAMAGDALGGAKPPPRREAKDWQPSLPAEILTMGEVTAYDVKMPARAVGVFKAATPLTVLELSKEMGMYRVRFSNKKTGDIEAWCAAEALNPVLQALPSKTAPVASPPVRR